MLQANSEIPSREGRISPHTKRGETVAMVHPSAEKQEHVLQKVALEKRLDEMLISLNETGGYLSLHVKIQKMDELLGLDEERSITDEVRQRARWIVEWSVQKTRLSEKLTPDAPQAEDGERIRELLFSYSPCVFSYLQLPDQLSLLAKSSRVESLQGSLVQPFIGEVVYELSFTKSPAEVMEKVWVSASLSDKLDFIDFIPTLFARARAQGEWAEPSCKAMRIFIQQLIKNESSFFTTTLLAEASQRIESEEEQPTAGLVVRSGDRRVGRMSIDQSSQIAEDAALKRKIPLQQAANYSLRRVSRDAIAAFDHASIPQGYVLMTEKDVTEAVETNVDTAALEQVEGWLKRPIGLLRPQAKWWCLRMIQSKLLLASEKTGDAWAARLPILSAEQWNTYWRLEDEQEVLVNKIRTLQAIASPTKEERAQLERSIWRSHLLQEELQPSTDLLYRDPQLHSVLRALVEKISRPTPVYLTPFEQFEDNRRLMPKGEKAEIEASVLLQVLHRPYVREKLEERMGLSLSLLTLREQIQLLAFLAESDAGKQVAAFQCIKKFGIQGARSFLSCEYDPKMGEVILRLSEERDMNEVRKIFEQYSLLVERAATSSESLHQTFFSDEQKQVISKEVFEDSLLARAKSLLADAAKKKDLPLEGLLGGYAEDLSVFVSVFKAVFKGSRSRVPFEMIRGLSIESVTLSGLDMDKKQVLYEELRPLVEENWKRADTDVGSGVVKRFKEGFFDPQKKSTFFLLRREGLVAACVRFDDRPDLGEDAVYAGSLNVSKTLQDSGIGGAFVREMVEHRIGEKELYADVLASDAVGSFYVEELGCVIDGVKYPSAGSDAFFSLRRSKTLNQQLTTKNESMHLLGEQKVSAAFDLPSDKQRFVEWVKEVTSHKRLVTRYQITRGSTGEKRFLMAEQAPSDVSSLSQLVQAA